jgi:signal transduction histidine kinase
VPAALSRGEAWARQESTDDQTYRLLARRFELPPGTPWVAVAAADVVEVQNEYAALIFAFGLAGLASLVLVALGGATLARRSTEPVDRAFAQMRRFMADAAHELRTPLTVLRGRADVALQRSRTADEYAAALSGIASETERMGSMVEKMMLLSQADSGELRIRREDVFLDDLLVDAAEDARIIAAERGVTVEIRELDEAPVLADRHLVRQMLLTVLDNAVRFTPSGGHVFAEASCTHGTATVTIRDTGPGIPSEVLPHVFEPFYRGDEARERAGGAGLGLTIAQSIADAHGATIDIVSEAGAGTRVRITFPCRTRSPHTDDGPATG